MHLNNSLPTFPGTVGKSKKSITQSKGMISLDDFLS